MEIGVALSKIHITNSKRRGAEYKLEERSYKKMMMEGKGEKTDKAIFLK